MDTVDPSAEGILRAAREELIRAGEADHAAVVTAVWEVCFGGCGFNLDKEELENSCNVARLLFCAPGAVSMMLRQAAGRVEDAILRGEIRKISERLETR